MGWTWMYDRPASVKAEMDSVYTSTGVDADGVQRRPEMKVLRSGIVGMREYYCALEIVELNGDRRVIAGVAMLDYGRRNSRDGLRFGYKDMSEMMGPCQRACPEAILDLLTETEDKHALEWRAECRARIALRKAKPKLSKGVQIKFDPPVKASGDMVLEHLRVLDVQKSRFLDIPSGRVFRAAWLKKCNYSIVNN